MSPTCLGMCVRHVCTCEQVIEEQQEAAERGETGGIGSSRIGDVLRASLLVRDAKSALVAVSILKERMNVVRAKPTPIFSLACHFHTVSTVA